MTNITIHLCIRGGTFVMVFCEVFIAQIIKRGRVHFDTPSTYHSNTYYEKNKLDGNDIRA